MGNEIYIDVKYANIKEVDLLLSYLGPVKMYMDCLYKGHISYKGHIYKDGIWYDIWAGAITEYKTKFEMCHLLDEPYMWDEIEITWGK